MRPSSFALALAVAVLTSGCALTQKSAPTPLRFFTLERVDAPAGKPAAAAPIRVRLGRVTSSENLRKRIVFRRDAQELGEYESLRWTENPEEYVRRRIARALFEQRPVAPPEGKRDPVLDVELTGCEEVRRGAERAGRVVVIAQLSDPSGAVIFRRTFAAITPAPGGGIAAVVGALDTSLDEVVERIVTTLPQP